LHRDWVESEPGATAAAEADAAELVSVLVDEAETDTVVGRDTASAPQLACGNRFIGCGETGELWGKPDGHTVCDLVGERRYRIHRFVEAFHHNQILGRVRKGGLARIVSDKSLRDDQFSIYPI
jgi:hypothetical protein